MSDTMITMLVMLAAELVLLLFVLLSVAWFRGRAARRRDERAIRLLVTRIRNSRAERETGIERFLDERMGLSGAELEQAKKAILQSELVLLKRFAEVYRGRDADAAARFDADLITALTPYHELKADNVVVASEPALVDNSELEKLREQNQLLSDELSGNMETMSQMLREFSTMFAGSSADAAATPAATTEPPADEPVTAAEPEVDIAREANAEAQDQAPPEPAGTAQSGLAAEGVSGMKVAPESQLDTDSDAARDDAEPEMPAQPNVQIEAGDDLDEVAELLEEEGPAEVVTFDYPDEFDVEAAQSGGKAFDQEGSEVATAVQAQDGDVPDPDPVGEADAAETVENFDADQEAPLKAQSRG